MSSLLQGEPGVPGLSGAPGKEGLIGPKVWCLSTVDIEGSGWDREGHSRAMGVLCQGRLWKVGILRGGGELVLRFQGGVTVGI